MMCLDPVRVLSTETRLVNVSTRQLTFEWNRLLQCSSVHYKISATGCGMCPAYTFWNNITCEGLVLNDDMKDLSVCTIFVKVVNCAGNSVSEYIKSVILKG